MLVTKVTYAYEVSPRSVKTCLTLCQSSVLVKLVDVDLHTIKSHHIERNLEGTSDCARQLMTGGAVCFPREKRGREEGCLLFLLGTCYVPTCQVHASNGAKLVFVSMVQCQMGAVP